MKRMDFGAPLLLLRGYQWHGMPVLFAWVAVSVPFAETASTTRWREAGV